MTALSIIQDAVLHQSNTFIAALIAPVAVLVIYLLRNELIRYQGRVKHLPGPTGWPIVGNLFQVRRFDQYSGWSIAKLGRNEIRFQRRPIASGQLSMAPCSKSSLETRLL